MDPASFYSSSLLGVAPDFITGFHLNPLGNGPIPLLFLGQEPLNPESLVRGHGEEESTARPTMAAKKRVYIYLCEKLKNLWHL